MDGWMDGWRDGLMETTLVLIAPHAIAHLPFLPSLRSFAHYRHKVASLSDKTRSYR